MAEETGRRSRFTPVRRELVGHRALDRATERGHWLPRLLSNHIRRDIRVCHRRTRGAVAGGDHGVIEPGHDVDERQVAGPLTGNES